jgi:chemotaxis protein CheX
MFMQSEVSAEIVNNIVESIFETMMDIRVSQGDIPWRPASDRVTASITLEGDSQGAVSLECNRNQACQFAGRFLSMDPPAAMDDDVRDMLGELVNMIGGNIKSVMASNARLSMPCVIDGSNHEMRICGSGVQDQVAFHFTGGHFWVTVAFSAADAKTAPGKDSMLAQSENRRQACDSD